MNLRKRKKGKTLHDAKQRRNHPDKHLRRGQAGHDLFAHRNTRALRRLFYQKLTDIYATAIGYNRDAPTTKLFFKKVQNKMHYAVHGQTAAELIVNRADAEKEHMGLTTWENAPDGKL